MIIELKKLLNSIDNPKKVEGVNTRTENVRLSYERMLSNFRHVIKFLCSRK